MYMYVCVHTDACTYIKWKQQNNSITIGNEWATSVHGQNRIACHISTTSTWEEDNAWYLPGDMSVCRFIGSLEDLGTARVRGRLNLREKEEKPPSMFCRLWPWMHQWQVRTQNVYTNDKNQHFFHACIQTHVHSHMQIYICFACSFASPEILANGFVVT